ncbi:lantibiotic dehydratase [Pedobacter foliorum]|uniref:lantibiotic dehydratase n=1 Tax=Pedobacter foliorum TaxID=2739058 RepID=UPI001566867F|nr:lantibiotic dehydratase [Pedobacter foliorum]NRF41117.1 lantibiotic dehydratase [Pedobacter foliorum]
MKRKKIQVLKLHPKALLRTPQFSVDAELNSCWEDLKVSISHAAPGFYSLIKNIDYAGLQLASEQVQYTVWKYFNRARYRATPFGSFAGVGILDLVRNHNTTTKVASKQHLHHFRDWSLADMTIPFTSPIEDLFFFANSSYYVFQSSIRYLSRFNDIYQLSEIESDPAILDIIKLCQTPISYRKLIDVLADKMCKELVEMRLMDLVEVQLLLTNRQTNIIGEDYFKRLNTNPIPTNKEYVIAERKVIDSGSTLSHFSHLPELISRLNSLGKSTEIPALEKFTSQFARKFGEDFVPVMRALDPEIGVGYDRLEKTNGAEDVLFSSFSTRTSRSNDLQKLKTHLLNFLGGSTALWPSALKLEDLIMENNSKASLLPNSITIIASFVNEFVHIESIAGCTTNAVLGRFSMCGKSYTGFCREIADLEQNANPEVLFFDIGYTGETKVDNINRRASIYDFQLNLLNYDTSADPLTLDDILLSIQGNELLLYSRKLNKRLIPRVSSAYNYSRSQLAIFRLLCDLQHQGIQTDLNLNLRDLFPGLSYYPRLTFKNIIVSPASWLVEIKHLHLEKGAIICSLKNYLTTAGVSQIFRVGDTDQSLCFDQHRDEDMMAFHKYLKKHKRFYLSESSVTGFAQDASGHSYSAQMVLSITHQQKIYDGMGLVSAAELESQPVALFPPGSKWYYFQIYCHHTRADELLLEVINPVLTEFRLVIEKWFFIRYDDNGHHLRLRICLKDVNSGMQLTARLSALLNPYLQSGIVPDWRISTYKREIQRYSAILIDRVENHFCIDSESVLFLLSLPIDTFEKYRLCEHIFNRIINSGLFSIEKLSTLIQSIRDSFILEFKVAPEGFKRLNEMIRKFEQTNPDTSYPRREDFINSYCQSLVSTLKFCEDEKRDKLFSDLLHMHMNRLFSTQQRSHEFQIYHLFFRMLKKRTI